MQNFQHPRRLLSTSINVKKVHKIENERRNVTLNEHLRNTNSSSRKFQVVEKCMSAYLFRNDLESFDHQYNLTSTLSMNNASLKKTTLQITSPSISSPLPQHRILDQVKTEPPCPL